MTSEEFVYADTVNLFGSDIQPPEIDALLLHLHFLPETAPAGTALPVTPEQLTAERAA
ncbi:hypothetical protein [Streptomyces sp. NPDC048527]|uniref:hypothetical protein n=1 Tax=Streptomyces sp. NPDC048527 TaxID=3365568 RepID=UPI003716E2C7